jgi:hypothetical protein
MGNTHKDLAANPQLFPQINSISSTKHNIMIIKHKRETNSSHIRFQDQMSTVKLVTSKSSRQHSTTKTKLTH